MLLRHYITNRLKPNLKIFFLWWSKNTQQPIKFLLKPFRHGNPNTNLKPVQIVVTRIAEIRRLQFPVSFHWKIEFFFEFFLSRSYAVRRVRDAFRQHKLETDPDNLKKLVSEAYENLEVIKRQVSAYLECKQSGASYWLSIF